MRDGVVEDIGENVHGPIAVAVAKDGSERSVLVVSERDEPRERLLVQKFEICQEELLQLLLRAVAPPRIAIARD